MKIIQGDLIALAKENYFDVIVHGCNCFCTMGAGIAKAIKQEFPEAYEADRQTEKGDKSKLGTISYASINRDDLDLVVVNAYTQFNYRGQGVLVDYDAVASVMQKIKQGFSGQKIGYPKIGAGLAKGDWTIIGQIIERELAGEDLTLVGFVR